MRSPVVRTLCLVPLLLSSGCASLTRMITPSVIDNRIHPEWRARVANEQVAVGALVAEFCPGAQLAEHERARRMVQEVLMPTANERLTRFGPRPTVDAAPEACGVFHAALKTAAQWRLDPLAAADLAKLPGDGGLPRLIVGWWLPPRCTQERDAFGKLITRCHETEAVELVAFLIEPEGKLLFQGLTRCGALKQTYWGSSQQIPQCDVAQAMKDVLNGAPFQLDPELAQSARAITAAR
jgi:hypothetical protein